MKTRYFTHSIGRRPNVYNIHAFLDNDEDGRNAAEEAIGKNVLENTDYHITTCLGMRNSEVEDLLILDIYAPIVQTKYGVNLNQKRFRHAKAKWSDRASELFQLSGKPWNKSVKMQLKRDVCNACAKEGINSLNPHRRGVIDALVEALEAKLDRVDAIDRGAKG